MDSAKLEKLRCKSSGKMHQKRQIIEINAQNIEITLENKTCLKLHPNSANIEIQRKGKTVKYSTYDGCRQKTSNVTTENDSKHKHEHTNVEDKYKESDRWYFSGELREFTKMSSFVRSFMPRKFARKYSKKIWVVVVPSNLSSAEEPPKMELHVYSGPQDPKPRTVVLLWKARVMEPNLHASDPTLTIVNESSKTRHKFLSAIEGDQEQLIQLYSACNGFPTPRAKASNQPNFSPGSSSQSSSATSAEGGFSPTGDTAKGKPVEPVCVICCAAAIEGACIPCGHMAGCMSCLLKIKSSDGVCPVCRFKIEQTIRLYAV